MQTTTVGGGGGTGEGSKGRKPAGKEEKEQMCREKGDRETDKCRLEAREAACRQSTVCLFCSLAKLSFFLREC